MFTVPVLSLIIDDDNSWNYGAYYKSCIDWLATVVSLFPVFFLSGGGSILRPFAKRHSCAIGMI